MLWAYLYILAVHYVGDFLLQTRWMALGKGKSALPLTVHVGVYTTTLFVGCLWWFESVWLAMVYAGLNGMVHWCVDFVTSRCTTYAHAWGWNRVFFNVIGFDQLLHQLALGVTLMAVIRSGV